MSLPAMDPTLHLTLRAALALLFVWAASHKLRDVTGFQTALANYDLLPPRWIGPSSILLIGAELGVAVGLWLPRLGAAAAFAAAGLLALYAEAIVINLVRGRPDIDCGCAGPARRQAISAGLVLRNVALVGAALASALPTAVRSLTWIDGVTIVAAVATVALLYGAVDGLLANAPQIVTLRRRGDAGASGISSPHLTSPGGRGTYGEGAHA